MGEFSRRASFFLGHDANGSFGSFPLPKTHIAVFVIIDVIFGIMVNIMLFGCYQDWPSYMKKAVARSGDGQASWGEKKRGSRVVHDGGEGAWVELEGVELSDAFSKAETRDKRTDKAEATTGDAVTVPKSVHFATPTVDHVEVANNVDLERGQPDEQGPGRGGSAREKTKGMHANRPSVRQMRKSGLLVVGAVLVLGVLFWPIHVIWFLLWLTIYKVWAYHHIHISTLRARAVARAHRTTDLPANKPVIIVSETIFVLESPVRDGEPQPSGDPTVTLVTEDENSARTTTTTANPPARQETETEDLFRSVMTYSGFKHLYPPPGKHSQRIKAFLACEAISPAPAYCRRKMREAEMKRQDILDAAAGPSFSSNVDKSGCGYSNKLIQQQTGRKQDGEGKYFSRGNTEMTL